MLLFYFPGINWQANKQQSFPSPPSADHTLNRAVGIVVNTVPMAVRARNTPRNGSRRPRPPYQVNLPRKLVQKILRIPALTLARQCKINLAFCRERNSHENARLEEAIYKGSAHRQNNPRLLPFFWVLWLLIWRWWLSQSQQTWAKKWRNRIFFRRFISQKNSLLYFSMSGQPRDFFLFFEKAADLSATKVMNAPLPYSPRASSSLLHPFCDRATYFRDIPALPISTHFCNAGSIPEPCA